MRLKSAHPFSRRAKPHPLEIQPTRGGGTAGNRIICVVLFVLFCGYVLFNIRGVAGAVGELVGWERGSSRRTVRRRGGGGAAIVLALALQQQHEVRGRVGLRPTLPHRLQGRLVGHVLMDHKIVDDD